MFQANVAKGAFEGGNQCEIKSSREISPIT